MKEDAALAEMLVLRRGNRLSITPVAPDEFKRCCALGGLKKLPANAFPDRWNRCRRAPTRKMPPCSAVRLSFAACCRAAGHRGRRRMVERVGGLSDAAESVAHVIAVGFAWFSLRLSLKPADETHPYGHAKIAYFSSAFEGGIILAAALWVIYQASADLVGEPSLSRPDIGAVVYRPGDRL
ncbi:MAG: cation transporter [Verrucomicrobiales bacterium]